MNREPPPGRTYDETGGRTGLIPGRGRRTCAVTDCQDIVDARGWCNRHLKAWRTYGDPLGKRPIDPTIRYEGSRRIYTVTCPRCGETRETTGVGGSRDVYCGSCAAGGNPLLRDREWLSDAYARLPAPAIARAVGSTPQTVLYWLRKHDIPVRTRAEAAAFRYEGTRGKVEIGTNRNMITGNISDRRPGSVRHVVPDK